MSAVWGITIVALLTSVLTLKDRSVVLLRNARKKCVWITSVDSVCMWTVIKDSNRMIPVAVSTPTNVARREPANETRIVSTRLDHSCAEIW